MDRPFSAGDGEMKVKAAAVVVVVVVAAGRRKSLELSISPMRGQAERAREPLTGCSHRKHRTFLRSSQLTTLLPTSPVYLPTLPKF